MERLASFLRSQDGKIYDVGMGVFQLHESRFNESQKRISLTIDDEKRYFDMDGDIWDMIDFYESKNNGQSFRICNECGKPFYGGMTDCCSFYMCEECFDIYQENEGLTVVDDDGCDGYYLDSEGNGTGIFYTEWY